MDGLTLMKHNCTLSLGSNVKCKALVSSSAFPFLLVSISPRSVLSIQKIHPYLAHSAALSAPQWASSAPHTDFLYDLPFWVILSSSLDLISWICFSLLTAHRGVLQLRESHVAFQSLLHLYAFMTFLKNTPGYAFFFSNLPLTLRSRPFFTVEIFEYKSHPSWETHPVSSSLALQPFAIWMYVKSILDTQGDFVYIIYLWCLAKSGLYSDMC